MAAYMAYIKLEHKDPARAQVGHCAVLGTGGTPGTDFNGCWCDAGLKVQVEMLVGHCFSGAGGTVPVGDVVFSGYWWDSW